MVWETGVQSQVVSYHTLKKWYLMLGSPTLLFFICSYLHFMCSCFFQVLLHMVMRYPIKCEWFSNGSIWPIDEILKGTTTLGQSGSEDNSNEWVLHIPQISKTGAVSSDAVVIPRTLLTPLQRMQCILIPSSRVFNIILMIYSQLYCLK